MVTMMRALRGLAFAVAAALVVACGGGGGGGSAVAPNGAAPVATNAPASGGAATAAFSLLIPSATTSSSSSRRPAFVSPGIGSVAIFASAGSASPPPTASTLVNVGPSAPGCTAVTAGTTCIINVNAVYGQMTFIVKTYSGTLGAGTLLSQATLTTTIVVGQLPIPLTLTGVVNSVSLALSNNFIQSNSGTTTLIVNALDPTGATIVGAGNYNVPINVTASDPSVALSATSVTAPNQPITVTAPQPTIVEFTASVTGLSGNAIAPAVLNVGSTYSNVYVNDFSQATVMVFPSSASFPMAPLSQLFALSPINLLGGYPGGPVVLGLQNGQIGVYANGQTAPTYTFTPTFTTPGLQELGLSMDANSNVYLLVGNNAATYRIATYPAGSSTATNVITGAATTFVHPSGIAVDGSGNIFELESSGTSAAGHVNEWTPGHQSGNVAPTTVLSLTPGSVNAIAASPTGNVAVVTYANSTASLPVINIFAPGATTATQLWQPIANIFRLAYGPNGDLYAGGVESIGVLPAGSNGPGYARSFGPIGGFGHSTQISVGGSATPTVPATTTVSGDFLAPAANRTWNYRATPQIGPAYTISIYQDPQPDISGNIAWIGYIATGTPADAAAGGGTIGAAASFASLSDGYHAESFGSVSNSTYGIIPGAPLLVPTSLTRGQTFTPYPGVTATVQGVGPVAGSAGCPTPSQIGAAVTYAVAGAFETVSFVPGCGITDFVSDNGTEMRLTSITSNPQIGQQAIARRVLDATVVDTLKAVWKHVFVPWVKP